jgi:hypothetical protein
MAITIDFNTFWLGQEDLKLECINYIKSNIGEPTKVTTLIDDESDDESGTSILFYYEDFSIDSFSNWDELYDYANETELYVLVYDHETHIRKGYWYDEDAEWIEQEIEEQESYLNNI